MFEEKTTSELILLIKEYENEFEALKSEINKKLLRLDTLEGLYIKVNAELNKRMKT